MESGRVNYHFGLVSSNFFLDLFESNDIQGPVCCRNNFVRL